MSETQTNDVVRRRDLVELRDAFQEWSAGHGLVWWTSDKRLALAIGRVLDLKIFFSDETP